MSLILEALRKSERERHGKTDPIAPLIVAPGRKRPASHSRTVPVLMLSLLLVAAIGGALVFLLKEDVAETEAIDEAVSASPVAQPDIEPIVKKEKREVIEPKPENIQAMISAPQPVTVPEPVEISEPAAPTTEAARQVIESTPAVISQEKSQAQIEVMVAPEAELQSSPVQSQAQIEVMAAPEVELQSSPVQSQAQIEVMAAPEMELQSSPVQSQAPEVREEPVETKTRIKRLSQMPVEFRRSVSPLHLDVLVYDDDPANRYVFINGREYAEGSSIKQGLEVIGITESGVELRFRGEEFLLTVDD